MRVELPAILGDAIGTRAIMIVPGTVRDALAQLRAHPKLGPLIFDESSELRRHVLVFVNETSVRHLASLDVELREHDRVAVVQSVSGG